MNSSPGRNAGININQAVEEGQQEPSFEQRPSADYLEREIGYKKNALAGQFA